MENYQLDSNFSTEDIFTSEQVGDHRMSQDRSRLTGAALLFYDDGTA